MLKKTSKKKVAVTGKPRPAPSRKGRGKASSGAEHVSPFLYQPSPGWRS